MAMKPEAKILVDKMWDEMAKKNGGVYFDWRMLNATAVDTPSKLYLLELIYKDWERLQEEDKNKPDFHSDKNWMNRPLYIGQAVQLFNIVMKIPEMDPEDVEKLKEGTANVGKT